MPDSLSMLLASTIGTKRDDIGLTIAKYYPQHLIDLMARERVLVCALQPDQKYNDASAELRNLGVDVDAWPVPPAGLFVVKERTLYLRSATTMTIIHELGHALDMALGNGIYLSGFDIAIREAYRNARAFVTPYAASGLDEYFAECSRAFVAANDAESPWTRATPERLKKVDPTMYEIISTIFTAPV